MPGKWLSMKEFDTVTREEFGAFPEFLDFIRRTSGELSREEAPDFFRAYIKKGVGDVIQARNYVGLIQFRSGSQVQVLPKIDLARDDENDAGTMRVFLKMLQCLGNFPAKISNYADLGTGRMALYEIFISMYLEQAARLAKRGLRSGYVGVEENVRFYKGKLLVNEQIRHNTAHRERFYVSYDEFRLDRAENRLIKSTLLKLLKISASAENVRRIRKLLAYFDPVRPSVNYEKDFSESVIDRTTCDYKDILSWSRVFLQDKSFTTFSGDTNARALLFPMEKLYEAYVAKNVKLVFGGAGYEVRSQPRQLYLLREGERGIFALRPDLVVKGGDGRQIIMDTKWKRLTDNPGRNYGISQADIYQMFAYCKRYATPRAWLLYPETREMGGNKKKIEFNGMGMDGDVEISVFFLNVEDMPGSLGRLLEEAKRVC